MEQLLFCERGGMSQLPTRNATSRRLLLYASTPFPERSEGESLFLHRHPRYMIFPFVIRDAQQIHPFHQTAQINLIRPPHRLH